MNSENCYVLKTAGLVIVASAKFRSASAFARGDQANLEELWA